MLAKRSELEIREFSILRSKCTFQPVTEVSGDMSCNEFMARYPIDIDFDIHQNKEEGVYFVFVSVEINPDNQAGYSIMAEGCGVFNMNTKVDEDPQLDALVLHSGVNICITNLRAYIANMTASYPMGKYNFHLIDMVDLLNNKRLQVAGESEEEKK